MTWLRLPSLPVLAIVAGWGQPFWKQPHVCSPPQPHPRPDPTCLAWTEEDRGRFGDGERLLCAPRGPLWAGRICQLGEAL